MHRDMRERLTMALRVHVKTTTVRQLELDATRNLLIGVMSLLIFTTPVLLTGLVAWVCRSIYYQTCINVDAAVVFSREMSGRSRLLTRTSFSQSSVLRDAKTSSLIPTRFGTTDMCDNQNIFYRL